MKKTIALALILFAAHILNAADEPTGAWQMTNITLQTKTGEIFGTLMIPKSNEASATLPVALIIAGSGPTDRDGNNPAMKNDSLKLLAQGLAQNGIASLRYDKRAIAASKAAGKNEADLRFETYVADAKAWVELLRADRRFAKITIIGHSEGSLIGALAADTADNYISIAGVGRPADEILKIQLAAQPKAVQDLSFPVIDRLKKGELVKDLDPMVATLFRPSVQPYMISWFKYDPRAVFQKLTLPVLILQGTGDVQVSVEDAKRLAAADPRAQLVIIDRMNHIFRLVDGDRQANLKTYKDASLPISDKLVSSISEFILKH